jgi:hypothetical protein
MKLRLSIILLAAALAASPAAGQTIKSWAITPRTAKWFTAGQIR